MRLAGVRRVTIFAGGVFLVCGGSVAAGSNGWQDDDGIGAGAGSAEPSNATTSGEQEQACSWGADRTFHLSGRWESGGFVFMYLDGRYWRISSTTGEVWVRAALICSEGATVVSSTLEWRRVTAPDPRVLAESVYDEVVRQVPVPEPALSPVGPGFVNLGMWLAVAEPEPISVTARAGSVWATTSAELVTTTFDMGDATVVVCDGLGDPIPESHLDSIEQSPVCGHTYTSHNDREPFTVTITSTWQVSWSGSGGAGGDLGTIDRTSSLAYDVLEIQTVGS